MGEHDGENRGGGDLQIVKQLNQAAKGRLSVENSFL